MFPLTKSELEDIWHNKPFNYLKVVKTNMKGKKKYRIKLAAYKYNIRDELVLEVLAKNFDEATREAKNLYRQRYPQVIFDGFFVNNVT
jgi:hypothetical protein